MRAPQRRRLTLVGIALELPEERLPVDAQDLRRERAVPVHGLEDAQDVLSFGVVEREQRREVGHAVTAGGGADGFGQVVDDDLVVARKTTAR